MTVLEDIRNIIARKYSRPKKLSDPGSDFAQEELETIIHKGDVNLRDTDLICIFQSLLPAGTYCESIYFMPLALTHICSADSDSASTLCNTLLWWISDQKDFLEKDKLYDRLLDFFESLFTEQMKMFTVLNAYPENCNRVTTIFDSLNSYYSCHGDLLLRKYVDNLENYEQAAWLIFFLKEYLYGLHRMSTYLRNIADDKLLLQKAYDIILANAINDEKLLKFWDKSISACGIS